MRFVVKWGHYRPLCTCMKSRKSVQVAWTYKPKRQFSAILTPLFAHNSRKWFFLDSKLHTRIVDHKSPFLPENQPKLMIIFRENTERLRPGPFQGPPFWAVTPERKTVMTCSLRQNEATIALYSHAKDQENLWKSFGLISRNVNFGQFWPPFLPIIPEPDFSRTPNFTRVSGIIRAPFRPKISQN